MSRGVCKDFFLVRLKSNCNYKLLDLRAEKTSYQGLGYLLQASGGRLIPFGQRKVILVHGKRVSVSSGKDMPEDFQDTNVLSNLNPFCKQSESTAVPGQFFTFLFDYL